MPGDPLTFTWSFDDGGTASGREVAHVFATAGTHTATLTVTDGAGVEATDTVTVAVDPVPSEPPPDTGPPPPPGDTGPPPPPGDSTQPPRDLMPPAVGLAFPRQRLARLSPKGIALRVSLSEPAALTLRLSVDQKTARTLRLGNRVVTLGRLSTRAAAGRRTLRVKLPWRLRRALGKARRVKVSLTGTAHDGAGNPAPLRRTITLSR